LGQSRRQRTFSAFEWFVGKCREDTAVDRAEQLPGRTEGMSELRSRTELSPLAQFFIESAREIAKPLPKAK
jgi:hypothetical protein